MIHGSEEGGINLVISGVLHLLKQHQQTLLKHKQLRRLFPKAVNRSLHLLLLGHGHHTLAGQFG